jgi:hypothetical protein
MQRLDPRGWRQMYRHRTLMPQMQSKPGQIPSQKPANWSAVAS